MKVEWDKVKKEFPVYPEGAYLVRVDSWERQNKVGKKPSILIKAKIIEPKAHANGHLAEFFTLSESSMWRVALFLESCLDYDVTKLPAIDTDSIDFDNLLDACKGRTMWWNVFVDNYDGKERNKTTTQDPYAVGQGNKPFDPKVLSDVPDWVVTP